MARGTAWGGVASALITGLLRSGAVDRLDVLADGVCRLALRTPTLPPATSTNLLIVGRSRLALVEPATPFEDERRVLDDALERLAAQGRRVAMLLVTHHHVDHVGDVERLRQRHGVPLLAHAATAERLRTSRRISAAIWKSGLMTMSTTEPARSRSVVGPAKGNTR